MRPSSRNLKFGQNLQDPENKKVQKYFIVQTLRTNELKVWTVLSTDDIYSI